MIEQLDDGWEINNQSYHKMNNYNVKASIISNVYVYGLQISTSDGGMLQIGEINEEHFNFDIAKSICEKALSENKDFEWWIANNDKWFRNNYKGE